MGAVAPLRLFVGIGVTPAVNRAIDEAIEPWRSLLPWARWVPAEDRHVTLKFLGGATEAQAGWVGEQLRSVAADTPAWSLRLTDLRAFPSPERARVLWAGVDDRAGRLATLALAVDAALAPVFALERRPFAPHLTIARTSQPLALPRTFVETAVGPEAFIADAMAVFRSHAHRPPPKYEALHVLAFEHLFE